MSNYFISIAPDNQISVITLAFPVASDDGYIAKPSRFGVKLGYGNGVTDGEYLTGVAADDCFEGDDDSNGTGS
jgi:hypothetical protein